jgi:hypothetical protein
MIKAIFQAIASIFGFARERQQLANAPEVQAAEKGKTDQELKDSAAKAIAEQDSAEVRRRLSS